MDDDDLAEKIKQLPLIRFRDGLGFFMTSSNYTRSKISHIIDSK